MTEFFTLTNSHETFPMRYEEVTNSSADFDKNIRGLLSHFFDGLVSETVLQLGPGVGPCFLFFGLGFPPTPHKTKKGTLLFLGYSCV